ncbi:differentially expressed in FDCP 8 homolog B-like [Xenia sp. Carnegie-2017]|uniref:differentially expressed in FDCP 8 homolog B-like n=1 Tax=Xenia sp. Carnegie-2017 TaxID=2897299 RepID=UPI001F03AFBA|nr:differentially expressed in FDCP 8 homolog B-like [Xenia sp. Carnegie-2017]
MTSLADKGFATQCVENSETQTLLLKNTSSNEITDHNGVDNTQVCDQTKGFIGKDIVQSTLGNSENYKEPELSERIEAAVSISSKKMFDANDFLLEESVDENSFVQNKYNVNDCPFEDDARTKNESTDDKSHEVHVTHSTAETETRTNDDERTEEFEHKGGKDTVVDVEGKTFNSKNKDTTDGCEKSSFETPKSIHRSSSSETNNVTEVSRSASFYDYRVRKVENPELVSSSYGSSFSDYTDDDKDLNFIPGIHRMSTKSIASSLERKSSGESAVSFDKNGFPVFESSHFTNSASLQRSSNEESTNKQIVDESDMFEDLLNVEEEHFSNPDNFAGLTASEELEIAIEHYKKMIMKRQEKSLPKDDLVDKLVKLRLRLQQEKDTPPVDDTKFHKILGHHFRKQEGLSGVKYFCDQCGKNIWTVWQPLFTCKDCGYHCHRKCLDQIQRSCVNKNLSTASYIFEICPDGGLDGQQYKCAECRRPIAFSKKDSVARICDYTGQYFCDSCHWNDHTIIPARVLRNWDFTPRKVCRSTKQLLELMKTKPMVNIQEINPQLFRYVEELREIGKLREDILIMKKYFLTCREALESKLLIQLKKRQHFVDNADMYSFQDLIDLNNDILLPEISKIHAIFLAHIKADCDLFEPEFYM